MANRSENFVLPSPKFQDEVKKSLDSYNRHLNPHFSTPNGMLLPRDKQPPPMYGPRGSTVPPQYMGNPRKRPAQAAFQARGQNFRPFQQNEQNNPRQPLKNGRGSHSFHGARSHGAPQMNGLDKEVNPNLLRIDWKLWCEGCDVNCRSEEEYQTHLANHIPCSVAECKFVGHPMIMQRHMRQAHNNETCGKQLGAAPSREEIEQWKEERRKRYPTKDNVILRQQAQEERFKRGERIVENKDRFPNRPAANGPQREEAEQKEPTHSKFLKRQKRRRRPKGHPQVTAVEKTSERIPFSGTSLLWDSKDPTSNALGMLGEYGSDSDSSPEEQEAVKSPVEVTDALPSTALESQDIPSEGEILEEETESKAVERLSTAPDEVNIKSSDGKTKGSDVTEGMTSKEEKNSKEQNNTVNDKTLNSIDQKVALGIKTENEARAENGQRSKEFKERHQPIGREIRKEKKWLMDYSKLRRSNQNTMLEKLLDSDIRHERNVLLQCVRHVVMNNFFGIGQPKVENLCSSKITEEIKE
uniref:FMR1-interacting protein 1 conserved domain-containing protein n=1 Tax=Anopheles atroparvus TaxID=41427 RepID=A0AAG5CVY8_ANOAO